MYFKVKITKRLPQAKSGGFTGNNLNKQVISFGGADMNAASRHLENTRYLKEAPRDEANLEAEGGETAFGDINGDGFTEHMLISGKRHHEGGVPLNLPDGTFIFSDTASMKITDCNILKIFGKACGKKGYTPAELAKPYDINKYRTILEDPNSDKVDKKTAELMIKNINLKLGALALAQEAKKGFPQGIPEVAQPYMEAMGLKEEDLMPQKPQAEAEVNAQAMQNPYENQGMGMQSPEEESMEQVQGMQNPQEEMMEVPPMAQYGMAMGDYSSMGQFNSENDSDNSQSTGRGGFFSNLFGGNNKRRIKNKNNTSSVINNYYGAPQQQPRGGDNYNYYNSSSSQGQDNSYVPQSTNTPAPQNDWNNVRNIEPTGSPVYGVPNPGTNSRFSLDKYTGNNTTPTARDGGSLDRYQSKGEVKSKVYSKDQLPKDAVVRDRITTDTRAGDYVKQEDGSYKKVTAATLGKTSASDTKSLGISVDEFKNQSPENALLIENANAIIEKGIKDKSIISDKNGNVKITGDWKGDFKDRVLLSRALNATNAKGVLGTDKYKVVSQSATGPYSKLNKGKLKGSGSFVGGFTPDTYEQRFIFEQAKGLGMSDDDAFGEVDRVQKDPKLKAQARRQFAGTLGIKDVPEDDKSLLSDDFYKKNYADVTKGIENILGESEYRPSMGNDQLSGLEYFDAVGAKPEFQYEQDAAEQANTQVTPDEQFAADEEQYAQKGRPELWLQDKLNMGLAAGDYLNEQKTLPWAPRYEPELMTPVYKDPKAELNAQSADINAMSNAMAQFLGPQRTSAGQSALFAQGAKSAAETLRRYNTYNTDIANQTEANNIQITNEAQRYNQAQNKGLYDDVARLNQNYRSNKSKKLHNLLDATNAGITNANKADAMNQLTPEYAIDTPSGGRLDYRDNKRKIKPQVAETFDSLVQKYMGPPYYMTGEAAVKAAKTSSGYSSSSDAVDPNIIGQMYGNVGQRSKKGGPVQLGYVMGSNVFPFMFT